MCFGGRENNGGRGGYIEFGNRCSLMLNIDLTTLPITRCRAYRAQPYWYLFAYSAPALNHLVEVKCPKCQIFNGCLRDRNTPIKATSSARFVAKCKRKQTRGVTFLATTVCFTDIGWDIPLCRGWRSLSTVYKQRITLPCFFVSEILEFPREKQHKCQSPCYMCISLCVTCCHNFH